MELIVEQKDELYRVEVSMVLTDDTGISHAMGEEMTIPVSQVLTESERLTTCHAAASHLVHKMISKWRIPLVHQVGQAIAGAIQTVQESGGEGPRSASAAGPATYIAERVHPVSPEAPHRSYVEGTNLRYWTRGGKLYCQHGVILYGNKCLQCERS